MQQVQDTKPGRYRGFNVGITYPSKTVMEILIAADVAMGAVTTTGWS